MAFNVTFTNAKGVSVNLNDGLHTFVNVGVGNDLMPLFSFQEHSSPLIPGSIITAVRVQPRSFSLPVTIIDEDRDAVLARVRNVFTQLNPMLGDGYLTVSNGEVTRRLYCRYQNGMSSDGTASEQFTFYVRAVITFYAADPYFYGLQTVQLTAKQVFEPHIFFPIFPLLFAASSVSTIASLQNDGNTPAFPVITVTGPLTNMIFENHTTGKHMEISTPVLEGEVITIDTRPRTRGVHDQNNVNRFSLLTALSSMFALEVGENNVEITIANGTEAAIVTVHYIPAYLSV